jgi:hypothetical protein
VGGGAGDELADADAADDLAFAADPVGGLAGLEFLVGRFPVPG